MDLKSTNAGAPVSSLKFCISVCLKWKWRKTLANLRSQIKRNRQNEKRRLRNRIYVGRARTFIKQAHHAIDEGNLEIAQQATKLAVSALDKAAEKRIIHKNNSARRKSRLMKKLNALEHQTNE